MDARVGVGVGVVLVHVLILRGVVVIVAAAAAAAAIDGVAGIRWHRLAAVRGIRLTGRDMEDLRFDHGVALVGGGAGIREEGVVEQVWRG